MPCSAPDYGTLLMHDDIRATDGIHAILASSEERHVIAMLADRPSAQTPVDCDLTALVGSLCDAELPRVLIAIAHRLAG